MTHLWKENERQNIGTPSIWLWGKHVAPVVHDLLDTMDLFRSQTALPALKAFGYMVTMVIKTFFLAWREALGHATVQYHLNLRDTADLSKDIPRTPRGLSLESSLNLRKIQGAIGENWATAVHPTTHPHQGQAGRWAESKRVDAGKVVENPWKKAQIPAKAVASQAPAAHEEIRGLDDIFDRPVTGLLMDSGETAPTRSPRRKTGASHQRVLPDYPQQQPVDAEKVVTKKERIPLESAQVGTCECQQSKARELQVQAEPLRSKAIPVGAGAIVNSVHASDETTDWYIMTEQAAYCSESTDSADSVPVPVYEDYEPCFESFDEVIMGGGDMPGPNPGLSSGGDKPKTAETHPAPAVEEEVIRPDFDSVEAEVSVPKSTMNVEVPVPVQKPVPWFAQESESAGDVDAALTSENSVPWFLQDLQERAAAEKAARATLKTEPVLADPKPAPKAETPKMPAKPVTPVVLPAPLPLSLEHELEDDLKSFEYMAQSNRILSNSISNLVDSYFRQAAQEEEPNFY
jgi:hypothetical protein